MIYTYVHIDIYRERRRFVRGKRRTVPRTAKRITGTDDFIYEYIYIVQPVYTVAKLSWKKRPQNLYAQVPVRTNNNMAADHVIARVEKRKQTVVNVFIILRIVLLSKIICQELKMIKKRGGTKCAYKNCHNNITKSKNISFFRFPKEAERLVILLIN